MVTYEICVLQIHFAGFSRRDCGNRLAQANLRLKFHGSSRPARVVDCGKGGCREASHVRPSKPACKISYLFLHISGPVLETSSESFWAIAHGQEQNHRDGASGARFVGSNEQVPSARTGSCVCHMCWNTFNGHQNCHVSLAHVEKVGDLSIGHGSFLRNVLWPIAGDGYETRERDV